VTADRKNTVLVTLDLENQLLVDAVRFAAETERSLCDIVEEGLRQLLAKRKKATAKDYFVLPKVRASGLRPDVDLSNSAALLDIMEGLNERD
jgi:hypothetical protein